MAERRVRLEVIMSQALEDDFLTKLAESKRLAENAQSATSAQSYKYTQISGATGRGYSSPKLANAVWPQENTLFILYCTDDEAESVEKIVNALRQEYVGEGLACFKSEAEEI